MFELDIRSRQPIYEQLIDKMKEMIVRELWQPHDQLPSVRTMAKQLMVNPNTIQKAYRELERDGWIYSIPGKGSFVAPRSKEPNIEAIAAVREQFVRLVKEARFLGVTNEQLWQWIREGEKEEGES
ncbi:GntR family transcriptional regulator [Geobacillus sp. DSP4a]|uniref:GntR family transcriptional regulator n=1 Tax=Geobacillus sp. DSP4a TaxID=2508873 RepID=UPI0006A30A01|nr:GntR family transcriptional regulator [Geobacillus sp. DSP4a]AKU25185.1 GntR family transcriptional regulator [Geobacillus sp. LC300]AKU28001.1 GntR family transcriptional regulator [Geobacillus sp. LC300]NNV00565.1 GntR family transcriptional regulator [Geobacillus sp. DSP4a]